jgi:hypothetical protein
MLGWSRKMSVVSGQRAEIRRQRAMKARTLQRSKRRPRTANSFFDRINRIEERSRTERKGWLFVSFNYPAFSIIL